jgi:Bardet-Biedl syndrome 9 protein
VSQTTLRLPLACICRAVPPVKVGAFRLTLDAEERKHTLAELFSDVLGQPTAAAGAESQAGEGAAGGGQGVTLRMHCGADVTLLASGKTNRLRVQAGSFEALQLVTAELTARLQAGGPPSASPAADTGGAASGSDAAASASSSSAVPSGLKGTRVSYTDPLPLADLKRFITEHWEARRDLAAALASLNDRAYQLRLVQKRLLTRFRDRTPASIGGLDKLLSATYEQVMASAEAVELSQAELAAAACRLRCAVRLFVLLLQLTHGLSEADAEALEAALPAEPQDSLDQGWEERADASLTHLLRAMTGKGKASGGAAGAEAPGLPESVEPLLRHVDILVERLASGVKPAAALRPAGPKIVRSTA